MYNNNNVNSELKFLDLLNIASFCIGIMNLNQNLTQTDKQELENKLDEELKVLVDDIHNHLREQDKKINEIFGSAGSSLLPRLFLQLWCTGFSLW